MIEIKFVLCLKKEKVSGCARIFTPSFKKSRHIPQIMKYDDRKIAGSLLFIGAVLCVLGIIIAEALYPGYSTSENYISDLALDRLPSSSTLHYSW